MSGLILGVDAGNFRAKVAGPYGVDSYRTAICDWFERDIVESFADDDMEFHIGDRKGFAGTIAAYEDIYGTSSMFGDTKAHEDSKIRVLLAIYRYIEKYSPSTTRVSIVTGQPIVTHKESEKDQIKAMLLGRHEFIVNSERVKFEITDVEVGAEGSGAFWCSPEMGTVHILDVGSGTVNAATVIDRRYINTASGTFNFGMETVNKRDLGSVARGIIRATTTLNWGKNDTVYICGGIAKEILPFIAEHYTHAKVLQPMLQNSGYMSVVEPVFANAVGFYRLARTVFS